MSDMSPCLLMVAPNGARRTKADHPAIPRTPEALAREASACLAAGAASMHLHVRDPDGRHLLDVGAYHEALAAIREAVGSDMVLQVTSEAGGRYGPATQRQVLDELRPEAVSIAVRELFGEPAEIQPSGELCQSLTVAGTAIQYILYSPDDLRTFQSLRERGVLSAGPAFLLFVLGRYENPPIADPNRLPSFLALVDGQDHWAVCAFGSTESDCMELAARYGGHARVGFENNLWRPDGEMARDNADLIRLARERIENTGRSLMTPREARAFLKLPVAAQEGTA